MENKIKIVKGLDLVAYKGFVFDMPYTQFVPKRVLDFFAKVDPMNVDKKTKEHFEKIHVDGQLDWWMKASGFDDQGPWVKQKYRPLGSHARSYPKKLYSAIARALNFSLSFVTENKSWEVESTSAVMKKASRYSFQCSSAKKIGRVLAARGCIKRDLDNFFNSVPHHAIVDALSWLSDQWNSKTRRRFIRIVSEDQQIHYGG